MSDMIRETKKILTRRWLDTVPGKLLFMWVRCGNTIFPFLQKPGQAEAVNRQLSGWSNSS